LKELLIQVPMKKLFAILFLLHLFIVRAQNCNALFSYGANFEKVVFVNQSTVANAHYFWNFGDGTGSNLYTPTHEYPENGIYLVTLYVKDNISNCSDYYEQWITITKYSTNPCSPLFTDSIYSFDNVHDYIKLQELSINCEMYNYYTKVSTLPPVGNNTYSLPKMPGNYLALRFYGYPNMTYRAAYKTCPNNYNRAKNYNSCSANFEFIVASEDENGQTIKFSAMNKSASQYKWLFSGMGQPIYRYTDTASIHFTNDFTVGFPYLPWTIYLATVDNNGCRDSMLQDIFIRQQQFTYVGIKETAIREIQMTLSPNPVKDKFTVEFENNIRIQKIDITNSLGQVVYSLDKPVSKHEIDLSFLSGGVYYLKAQNNSEQRVFKIIRE
jgi:hypothetical protein